MSADDEPLYRVLYTDADGDEQVTGAMPLDAARSRARDLEGRGYAVAAVLGDIAAQGYMHAKARGGRAQADANPFAPDLTMSPEVADFILRAVNGLLLEGYWPKGYDVDGRHGGTDDQDYDDALVRRAVEIVGRDKIVSTGLQQSIVELDADAGETT